MGFIERKSNTTKIVDKKTTAATKSTISQKQKRTLAKQQQISEN